jgi:hypothetical protein
MRELIALAITEAIKINIIEVKPVGSAKGELK